MIIDEIKELMQMLEKSTLSKLQIKKSEFEITIEKQNPLQVPVASEELVQTIVSKSASEMIVDDRINRTVQQSISNEMKINGTIVKAPLVGVYYKAASPDAEPFVKVGQAVKEGDTICIIEAMKILNEIKAPVSGVVKQIHTNNGDIVEFEQILMEIGD